MRWQVLQNSSDRKVAGNEFMGVAVNEFVNCADVVQAGLNVAPLSDGAEVPNQRGPPCLTNMKKE